jgi:hypothetical protein
MTGLQGPLIGHGGYIVTERRRHVPAHSVRRAPGLEALDMHEQMYEALRREHSIIRCAREDPEVRATKLQLPTPHDEQSMSIRLASPRRPVAG